MSRGYLRRADEEVDDRHEHVEDAGLQNDVRVFVRDFLQALYRVLREVRVVEVDQLGRQHREPLVLHDRRARLRRYLQDVVQADRCHHCF